MATVLADTLLRLDPENPDSLALLGKFQFNNLQNPEQARVLLDKALSIDPKHIPSLLAMVPLHVQAQELGKVDETLGRILAMDPENLNALRLDAEMLSARYGLAAGLRAYNRLLNKYGGDLGLRLRYAEMLLQSGRISEGKSLADQLTSSRVPAIERSAHWMLAQVYAKARLFEEAVTHARRTLVLAPDTRNVQLFLGKCLMELGKHGEARIVLEAAYAKSPQDASVVDLLSQVLINLDESDKALALIAKTLQAQPEMDALRMRLVEIRMRGDNWQESLVDARTLHEKFPENPALANNYAFQLARSGSNLDQALGLMQPLYEQYRDNPVIMDTYATVLAAMKRHAEAIAIYQEALLRAPGNTSIRFHLAKSLAAVGDVAQARQELEAVLRIEPGFPQAKEVRDMLQGLPVPPRSGT